MTLGTLFYVIALIIFLLTGIGAGIPNGVVWGLFCLTLGLLLGGVVIPSRS
jgi:hypothetical protein